MGSHDFLGINFYTSGLGIPKVGDITIPSYWEDKDADAMPDPNWYTYVSCVGQLIGKYEVRVFSEPAHHGYLSLLSEYESK